MQTRFYQPTVAHTSKKPQGILKRHQQVRLTKEARAAVNARQCDAAHRYKVDIDEAWSKIAEETENIAAAHHKSVRQVQSELHMGQKLAHTKRTRTNAWNTFIWKKTLSLKGDKEEQSGVAGR